MRRHGQGPGGYGGLIDLLRLREVEVMRPRAERFPADVFSAVARHAATWLVFPVSVVSHTGAGDLVLEAELAGSAPVDLVDASSVSS
jgi:hypothetical protein